MRHSDVGRMLWAWLKENSDTEEFTITRKSIIDTYGDPANQWTAKANGGTLDWISRCTTGTPATEESTTSDNKDKMKNSKIRKVRVKN